MKKVITWCLCLVFAGVLQPASASVKNIGAIYATQSKLLQRIYIPDVDDSEITQQHTAPGESLRMVPIEIYRSGGIPAVQAVIGAPTFSGRCVVVDETNTVIDIIIADPSVYSDRRGKVVADDNANLGDKWDGVKFSREKTP